MNKLYISMYHYIRDLEHSRYPRIKGLDVKLFRKQIEFMVGNFNVVTMEQVMETVEQGKPLPDKALLLTFDDGYIDHFMFAFPILEEFRLQGSFFIPGKTFTTHRLLDVNKIHYLLASADIHQLVAELKRQMDHYRGQEFDYAPTDELFRQYAVPNRFDTGETIFVKRMLQTVLPEPLRNRISSGLFKNYLGITEEQLAFELYMTENQIRTMKRHGMFIGIHGFDHYWLGNLPLEQMKKDVSQALDALGGLIDRGHWAMNYPYGNYSQEVLEFIEREGACVGFSTEVRVAEIGKDNPLTLPRLDCNDFPPKSQNYKLLS